MLFFDLPPIAAKTGNDAFFKFESSPSINSRLISKPTKRKNIAIKPSLTQAEVVYVKSIKLLVNPKGVAKKFAKEVAKPELAITKEIITQINKMIPPTFPE